ncbi:STAS domain-containing protein [Roseomonas frigidaquae]|uniref:STAS domain-containing protein n=1 Tax=Falsiroseomonas frigidaquae TaxID=487318 RepID=A0ABX1F1Z1_9PROT|nr:STAS domain-containing protein [Falsiroseomonas frigidaquae]NKE46309.1 STAS domain-containing protein [Falsiroseomonas frigidaquae]
MSDTPDAAGPSHRIALCLREHRAAILRQWFAHLVEDGQIARIDAETLRDLSTRLLDELIGALDQPHRRDLAKGMADLLSGISIDFVERGFTPSRTATFIFSLKHPIFPLFAQDPAAQFEVLGWIDRMGLHSIDAFIARREAVIRRQTQELLEVSVPVVPLAEGILSLPIIGTLDSGRAQAITEKLLSEIARTASRYAVLDISGVPTVDTQTAQYLARTAAAARLMGSECVITGIRPAIAQVMVALGIDMASIETRFSLADGLRHCLGQQGLEIAPRAPALRGIG